jgi:DNA-binding NarL/FixJ family response regulator
MIKRIQILIVDDQPMIASALSALLENEPDFEVIGTVTRKAEAIQLTKLGNPEIILLDVQWKKHGPEGLHILKEILKQDPQARIIMLTSFSQPQWIDEAMKIGARGYILKQQPPSDLIHAIRLISNNNITVHPDHHSEQQVMLESLTLREIEVLQFVAQGLSNKEIGRELRITSNGVRRHLQNIFAKLGVDNRVKAINVAREQGFLSPE